MSHDSPEPPTAQVRWTATVPSPAPRRRRLLVPAVAGAAALAVAVAGGGVAYLVTRSGGPQDSPAPAAAPSTTPAARTPAGPIDACATVDALETDRLVPRGKAVESVQDKRDSDLGSISWSCTWQNLNHSFGEYSRQREITVKITQHQARKNDTADTVSRTSYGHDLEYHQYLEHHPNKEAYYSPVRTLPGVGDEAHAQYTWYKGTTPNAFGEGFSRIGDVTVTVKYQASQQRKDLPLFTSTGKKAVTEENALREVTLLLGQVSQSVAAWREGRPYARSTPAPTPTGPTPTPTPVPIALPATCAAVAPVATPLVPGAATKSERTQDGGRTIVTCRWNNREIPVAKGLGMRTVFVSFTTFTNRAGAPDTGAAKQYYIDLRAKAKEWEGSGFQGLFYYKVTEPKGWGERAHYQYRKNRTPSAHAGIADSAVLTGPTVIEVTHGGSERPEGTPINSPKSVLMPQKQAVAGLLPVTEAVVEAFERTGIE
ncbi:hypothetical protein [Planomonospora venezuelensis]|uniref:Uncharacterized protein n=1 Tax=Planomonospora venezuelensis TaxID=1999 RepID=A0A841D2F8_PLAVE|nr:hypothetical protein [Planomonospora venezuelensis]MBB5963163.1 hypothetical protein [Planomonospora venezuelensis]GIN00039.1 hypothetical protein Pve01_16970 [Planomonospora venezuelensis]